MKSNLGDIYREIWNFLELFMVIIGLLDQDTPN